MDYKINFQYLCCVLLFGFLDSILAEKNCNPVRTEFHNRKIGPPDLVPNFAIHDNEIKICFDPLRDPTRLSCCSKASEQQYVIAAKKYLKDSVRSKTAFLKKSILDHILQFEERLSSLILLSENKTSVTLEDLYKIPKSEYSQTVSEFFSQIRLFMKQKQVSLYASVATFYDNIFPSVLKYNLHSGKVLTLTPEQTSCLRRTRQDIVPVPFGKTQYNISHSLQHTLSNVKSYIEVLSLVVEAINLTDNASVTEKCVHQVTQLQFCSRCQNETTVLPCKGLCLNTMRRCLAQFSILHQDWKKLMMSVVRLDGGQSDKYNVEAILQQLSHDIDMSIKHAVRNIAVTYNVAKGLCHISAADTQIPIRTASSELGTQLKHNRNRRTMGGDLNDQVLQVKEQLLISMNIFSTLSEDICEQKLFYDQDPDSNTCWNGTLVGRFTGNIEHLKAFTTSEMDVDPQLITMRDKLSLTRNTLDTEHQEYSMMSDSSIFKYGSGDGGINDGGGIVLETDDEDLNGSGSGSGDGSGQTPSPIDVTLAPTKSFNKPPNRNQRPENSASSVSVSMVMAILTVITTLIL